jgi:predicted AlkP superfamily phosphohydrolase/phosphomutase
VELLPSPPCDTPTNWTTIATGAWTGTHGSTGFNIRLPGTSHSAPAGCSFDTRSCGAEYLWDVTERAGGRCLLYDYPSSRPSTLKHGIVLGGWFTSKTVGSGAGTFYNPQFEEQEPVPAEVAAVLAAEQEKLETKRPEPKGFDGRLARFLRSQRESFDRFLSTLAILKEKVVWDHLFCHHHGFDAFNHGHLNDMWEDHPGYNPDKGETAWRGMRRLYRDTDAMLEKVIARHGADDTVVCVVGDHGCLPTKKFVWPGKALEEAGLTRFQDDDAGGKKIDVSRSPVVFYFSPPGYLWINLRGREPDGIVRPGTEYRDVVARAVDAIRGIRDPENGRHPFSLVLPKEEAAFLGQWGPRVGDIVIFTDPDYALVDFGLGPTFGKATGGVAELLEMGHVGAGGHANHHGHLPTARTGIFSNSSFMILRGLGIRQGKVVAQPRQMVDVAPTLARSLGLPLPAGAEGGILHEILD